MSVRRTTAVAAVATATAAALAAAPAQAHDHRAQSAPAPAPASLAAVLDADGDRFDRNPKDFDVVDRAVRTVLGAKPDSAVAVLADGSTAVTAFLPNDVAFKRLVTDLTGEEPATERAAFDAVASLGVDTVETVLLYHVVPGDAITLAQARRADGAELATAQGGVLTVDVRGTGKASTVKLVDLDPDAANPQVNKKVRDIRAGEQIAHSIGRVLRPVDL